MLFFKKSQRTWKKSEKVHFWLPILNREPLLYLIFYWQLLNIASRVESKKCLTLNMKKWTIFWYFTQNFTLFWRKIFEKRSKLQKVPKPDFFHPTFSSNIGLNLLRNLRVIKSGFRTSEKIYWAFMLYLYKNWPGDFSWTKPRMYFFYIF